MDRDGKTSETVLNLLTVLALLSATALLFHDRGLPAMRDLQRVDPGQRVPGGLRMRELPTGDPIRLVDLSPLTLLGFLSTCPSCERSTPAWREALKSEVPDPPRFAAVSLGDGPGAVVPEQRHHIFDDPGGGHHAPLGKRHCPRPENDVGLYKNPGASWHPLQTAAQVHDFFH